MDLPLARRIEGANAEALDQHRDIAALLFPEIRPAAIRVAGGVASFVGADVPVSYAVGLGLHGPVSADDVARVVEFFESRKMPPRVDVCPFADASLLLHLREQGFALHWFVNVLVRELSPHDALPPLPDGINVRLAEPAEAELWTSVVDEGFADGAAMTAARRQLGLILFHRPAMYAYFAEIEGEIAGAGALFTHAGYAALAATSTRPAFRRRGVHAALIRARLEKARALGCDLAGFFATPGTQSQRNAERHGFAVAYTKATLKKG